MEKKLTKIEKLEKALKEAKKAEKDKYEKSREKYRLRLGKLIDEIMGQDLDLASLKKRLKVQKKFIIMECAKSKEND